MSGTSGRYPTGESPVSPTMHNGFSVWAVVVQTTEYAERGWVPDGQVDRQGKN